jgi:hypothetical protein
MSWQAFLMVMPFLIPAQDLAELQKSSVAHVCMPSACGLKILHFQH